MSLPHESSKAAAHYAAIKAVTLSEADVRAITAPSPGLAEVWRFYANEEKREQ